MLGVISLDVILPGVIPEGVILLGVVPLGVVELGVASLGVTLLGVIALEIISLGVVSLGFILLGIKSLCVIQLRVVPLEAIALEITSLDVTLLGVKLLGVKPLGVMVAGVKPRGFTQIAVGAARGSNWIVEGLGLQIRGHRCTHPDVNGSLLLRAFRSFPVGEIKEIIFSRSLHAVLGVVMSSKVRMDRQGSLDRWGASRLAVSYTHLTLPTKRIV